MGKLNNAEVSSYGTNVSAARFEFKKKGKTSSLLRIVNVTEEDAGVYACVLRERKGREVWRSGTLLLPGGW